jgi:hypothetical protein
MSEEEPAWHDFSILFRELGAHAGGRSYYEDELEEELERLGLGEVVGGGTWMDGSGCDIGVVVSDSEAGLRVIRDVLRRLHAPESTRIVGDSGEYGVYE